MTLGYECSVEWRDKWHGLNLHYNCVSCLVVTEWRPSAGKQGAVSLRYDMVFQVLQPITPHLTQVIFLNQSCHDIPKPRGNAEIGKQIWNRITTLARANIMAMRAFPWKKTVEEHGFGGILELLRP